MVGCRRGPVATLCSIPILPWAPKASSQHVPTQLAVECEARECKSNTSIAKNLVDHVIDEAQTLAMGSDGAGRTVQSVSGASSMAIDVHAHHVSRGLLEVDREFRLGRDDTGEEQLLYGDRHLGPFSRKLVEIDEHLAAMESLGIGHRLLCTASWLNFYWLPTAEAERIIRAHNELLAQVASDHPRRFSLLASVPLQDAKGAIRMLESAVRTLDAAGIAVGSNVNGVYFDDGRFDDFLAAAADLQVPLFLHPDNVVGSDRLQPYGLRWLVGNAIEASVALSRLLLGGVFDRHPQLKLCVPLGGGGIAQLIGRMDHGWEVRPDARTSSLRRPSEYLDRCWFDTVVHSARPLRYLAEEVGLERLVLGTDFPWAMGVADPLGAVAELGGSPDGIALVARDNARRLIAPQRAVAIANWLTNEEGKGARSNG